MTGSGNLPSKEEQRHNIRWQRLRIHMASVRGRHRFACLVHEVKQKCMHISPEIGAIIASGSPSKSSPHWRHPCWGRWLPQYTPALHIRVTFLQLCMECPGERQLLLLLSHHIDSSSSSGRATEPEAICAHGVLVGFPCKPDVKWGCHLIPLKELWRGWHYPSEI